MITETEARAILEKEHPDAELKVGDIVPEHNAYVYSITRRKGDDPDARLHNATLYLVDIDTGEISEMNVRELYDDADRDIPVGIYFSGTGNSRYALEVFMKKYHNGAPVRSIEDKEVIKDIAVHREIIFSYPVQYSDVPKIVRDFIDSCPSVWNDKRVTVIATMGLFSGDGAGALGRLLERHGAKIVGGLHLRMPDSIADEKVLKRSHEDNVRLVKAAEDKIALAVDGIKKGKYPREGLGMLPRMAGFFGQRAWFGHKTRSYSDGPKIDPDICVGCGKCAKMCPTGNITMKDGKAHSAAVCTLCYRCVNICPKQAITLLGKQMVQQTTIERYL